MSDLAIMLAAIGADGMCRGFSEVWDQTLGCPACGDELWNYPYLKERGFSDDDAGIAAYEASFMARHRWMGDEHDDGDEDPIEWECSWRKPGRPFDHRELHYAATGEWPQAWAREP
jgi:hypothetical protein